MEMIITTLFDWLGEGIEWLRESRWHGLMVFSGCFFLIFLAFGFWPVGEKAKFYYAFGILPDANPLKVDQAIKRVLSQLKDARDRMTRQIGEWEAEFEQARGRGDSLVCKRMIDHICRNKRSLERQESKIRCWLQLAMRFHAESTQQLIAQLELGEVLKEEEHKQS